MDFLSPFLLINLISIHRSPGLTYSGSGVDITAGDSLVQAIKPLAKATARAGCDAALGGFGGLFDVRAAGYKDPILVSGTDGVGTKLKVGLAVATSLKKGSYFFFLKKIAVDLIL